MRNAENDPLEHCVHEYAHQEQVYHGSEATSQKVPPKLLVKKQPIEERRPALLRVAQPAAYPEHDRYQRLQNES